VQETGRAGGKSGSYGHWDSITSRRIVLCHRI
jgi:hypothetical protein